MMSLSKHELLPFDKSKQHHTFSQCLVQIKANFPHLTLSYTLQSSNQEPFAKELSVHPNVHSAQPTLFHSELWKNSCLEFFIKTSHSTSYHEWNFSFDGKHYAHFEFESHRKLIAKQPLCKQSALNFSLTQLEAQKIEIKITLDLSIAPSLLWSWINKNTLFVHPTFIHKDRAGVQHFFATRHPPTAPDFHNDRFYSAVVF